MAHCSNGTGVCVSVRVGVLQPLFYINTAVQSNPVATPLHSNPVPIMHAIQLVINVDRSSKYGCFWPQKRIILNTFQTAAKLQINLYGNVWLTQSLYLVPAGSGGAKCIFVLNALFPSTATIENMF